MDYETPDAPAKTMYAFLKRLGVSNKEVAGIVLTDKISYGSAGSPRDRISDRTFLSREVVNAEPGKHLPSFFADLHFAADSVTGLVLKRNNKTTPEQLIAAFSGEGSKLMQEALKSRRLPYLIYANMVDLLNSASLQREEDRLALHVLLFVTTGCLGNPGEACETTAERLSQLSSKAFSTSLAEEDASPTEEIKLDVRLGLCRLVDGKLRGSIHPLSTDPTGTEIGSLSSSPGSINDVDPTVSRRHLLVYRDEDGNWYAQGLGSTNGTTVIRGAEKNEEVIELPRKKRDGKTASPAVPIYASDVLVLAQTTKFFVVEIAN